ncbi:YkgJ family cysteine cluster protein [Fusibacter ferrireducens]|uniref:YkgJ family cysteine cluster protein n=1 Tax=Fusibacter ferrireducens TaxID=2785058 RepID=A0ABR9ZUW7_9FIRM|nr:YkgJ family cysteine cluster protein [Fusibacter ferrireducens]
MRTNSDIKTFSKWYSNEIDAIFKIVDNLEELEIKNSCGEECAVCCSQFIIVNPVEYENIKYYLKHIDRKIKNQIKEKSIIICTDLMLQGYKLTYTVPYDRKEVAKLQKNYKYPCPLLIDSKCIIYEVRPLTCAIYRNYGERKECYENKFSPLSYSHLNIESFMTKIISQGYHTNKKEYSLMAKVLNDIL